MITHNAARTLDSTTAAAVDTRAATTNFSCIANAKAAVGTATNITNITAVERMCR